MSRPRSIFILYLCDLFFIFIFIFIMTSHMNTGTLALLLIFQNMSYCFCLITWMKNAHNFQIPKLQPQGAA